MKNNSLVGFLEEYKLDYIDLKFFRKWINENKNKLDKCVFISTNKQRQSYTVYNKDKLYDYFINGIKE